MLMRRCRSGYGLCCLRLSAQARRSSHPSKGISLCTWQRRHATQESTMAKRILVASLVALICLGSGAIASADPGGETASLDRGPSDAGLLALITDDDVFSLADLSLVLVTPLGLGGEKRTQHYGPFPSDSPDSGTCGNTWSNDTFDRHF